MCQDRRTDRPSRSRDARDRLTRENISAALLVAPTPALEHLEYGYVLLIESIAFDRMQVHRLEPELAHPRGFGFGERLFRKVALGQIIASASEKVAQSKDED